MNHFQSRGHKAVTGIAAVIALCFALTSCGASAASTGPVSLTWYINPDGGGSDPHGGGQAQLARECSTDQYHINIQLLPNSASDQQTQLLRRLASGSSDMDLMSVDPAFVTQFAAADYFAPVPKDMVKKITSGGTVKSSVKASTYSGKIIAVPFWANTQLLWYRKSVAKKAGLDMSKPVSWVQLIKAAQKTDTAIGVQAAQYEGYSVWINALVEGAGGHIVENPNADYQDIKMGLDSKAGRQAAAVIKKMASTGVGGPAMGSSEETQSLDLFANPKYSSFMVNWPYVYAALGPGANGKDVSWFSDDLGFTMYPSTVSGESGAPPFGGIELAVGQSSNHIDLAYDAAQCITNVKHQADYMVGTGNPAAAKAAYEKKRVKKAFPHGLADLIRKSLQHAAPRPLSPYWGDISTALQQKFSPPHSVTKRTPAKAQQFILDVLNGKALL